MDYDATIAQLKVAAMRQLRSRASAPFSIPQGDLPNFYAETLDAVAGPMAEKLMAALMSRDNWQRAAEERHEQNERWIQSCLSIQSELETAHKEVDALREALEASGAAFGQVVQLEAS